METSLFSNSTLIEVTLKDIEYKLLLRGSMISKEKTLFTTRNSSTVSQLTVLTERRVTYLQLDATYSRE